MLPNIGIMKVVILNKLDKNSKSKPNNLQQSKNLKNIFTSYYIILLGKLFF